MVHVSSVTCSSSNSNCSPMAPKMKLYFLQASRCIRTAWLLEALGLDYEVIFSPRRNKVAPTEFKEKVGGLGKFPALEDDGIFVTESGNIIEYLCDTYDTQHKYLPAPGDPRRYQVLQWVHASEGTFMTHGLAITYARWFQKDGSVEKTEEGLQGNVIKDFDYLEKSLQQSGGKWISGKSLTVADMAMHFSITFILARQLGTKDKKWEAVNRWIESCEAEDSFKQAVQKTGYDLSQSG